MPRYSCNDVDIWYESSGEGKKKFLLLHNAGGDHQFMLSQMTYLSSYGQVINIDLPYHGRSKYENISKIGVKKIADMISAFIQSQELQDLTLVGLNYGANIALEIMSDEYIPVNSAILIDPPILFSEEVTSLIINHISELGTISNETYALNLVENSFIEAATKIKKMANDVFKKMPHQILKAIYSDLIQWDSLNSKKVLQETTKPQLYILTDGSLCSEEDIKKYNSSALFGKVVNSLYWATLEVPEQVNAMIRRYLEVLEKNPKFIS